MLIRWCVFLSIFFSLFFRPLFHILFYTRMFVVNSTIGTDFHGLIFFIFFTETVISFRNHIEIGYKPILICTDFTYHLVLRDKIYDADCLVHFSLPDRLLLFKKRFAAILNRAQKLVYKVTCFRIPFYRFTVYIVRFLSLIYLSIFCIGSCGKAVQRGKTECSDIFQ